MAKCTETCPKCGAAYRNQFNESDSNCTIDYWECDSFRRNIHGPQIRHSTRCQLVAANAEIERLRALLAEAHEAVSNWGLYAGDYFQEKWGWQQDVEKFAPFAQYYPKDHPHD